MDEPVQERKDLSAATFRRQRAETRELLGDRLSLYQIHSATIESGVLDDDELLAELAALRRSGVAVDVTVTGPRQAETIDLALEVGIFDTVQATWNLLERSAAPALRRAHDAGLGVIVKEVLANGRLTNHGAEPALLTYAHDRDLPPDAVAIAAAISQPWSIWCSAAPSARRCWPATCAPSGWSSAAPARRTSCRSCASTRTPTGGGAAAYRGGSCSSGQPRGSEIRAGCSGSIATTLAMPVVATPAQPWRSSAPPPRCRWEGSRPADRPRNRQ